MKGKKSVIFITGLLFFVIFQSFNFADTDPVLKKKEMRFLSINDEMKDFAENNLSGIIGQREKLIKLISSLHDRTKLGFKYSNLRTYTAEETFKNRSGNCLSYTAMFIVLARHAGLSANFQEVFDFSDWSRKDNVMVFSRHMNAIVKIDDKKVEVDFRYQSENRFLYRMVVSDKRAEAHYYNNLGAEALMLKKYKLAESLFNRGIGNDRKFSLVWSNLGVLYQHINKIKLAEKTYNKAIKLDKTNYSAKLNLSNLYIETGRNLKGKQLQNNIKRYLKKNPYYHFSLGKIAYEKGLFEEAKKHYKRAIRRDSKVPEFFVQLGAVFFKLGNKKFAERYIKKAAKLARSPSELELYKKKLNYIYINIKKKKI
ncbi:MAG: tetratricopeptide repeat protein [Acidobacteriota bacterium]